MMLSFHKMSVFNEVNLLCSSCCEESWKTKPTFLSNGCSNHVSGYHNLSQRNFSGHIKRRLVRSVRKHVLYQETNMADNCIHLREFQISERKLRFLEWASTDPTDSNSQISQDSIPLFLGADVLSGCSIAVSNLPRMHAKFSRQGLAVKVNFPTPLRLQGVHGSARGVWFYSIQGLFRVCFEYYNREEQLECLTKLCSTWKMRFSDPPLKQEIEIGFQSSPSKCLATPEISGETTVAETSDSNENFKPSESLCTQTVETFSLNSRSNLDSTCLRVDNNYCITQSGKKYFEEIVRVSKNEDHCEFNCLLETTTRILKEFEVQKSQKQNGLSRVLLAISKCLGEEFHKLQPEINERVTEFKKKHITSIDNLPPSSSLVKELFPECMRVLLLSWMGSDNRQNISSIIQVILELANTSLVSGVAHVLFSRLIRTDTV